MHADAIAAAMEAMRQGFAAEPVAVFVSGKQTLADMLSEHTCNYNTTLVGNPCELLAILVAVALQSACPQSRAAAELYAARIALDYATANEPI
jgi:CelD/BcsL family acetyltransferase involved in cellulose biosynthesis